jgi:hypothetical protein
MQGSFQTPTSATTSTPEKKLRALLNMSGAGRKTSSEPTLASQRKQVTRQDQAGVAKKVAGLFESVISSVNQNYGLRLYPVRLQHVLANMGEGKDLLQQAKENKKDAIMATAHVDLLAGCGRAHTATVLGNLAKPNSTGKLHTRALADMTGKSESWIRACRQTVTAKGLGLLGAASKSRFKHVQILCPTRLDPSLGECTSQECTLLHDCQCCRDGSRHSAKACPKWNSTKALRADKARVQRVTVLVRETNTDAEVFATRAWMRKENPARSGDQKDICWMVKGKFDFYHEHYRTAVAQIDIFKIALEHYGDDLRTKATSSSNPWLRNLQKYLDAVDNGQVDELAVATLNETPEGALNFNEILAEVLEISQRQQLEDKHSKDESDNNESDNNESDNDDDRRPMTGAEDKDHLVLKPRCYQFFYNTLLRGERLWHRPPHNHCERCAKHTTASRRLVDLQTALLSLPDAPDHTKHIKIVERAGGPNKAWEEVRSLQLKVPDLQKHVKWEKTARAYLKQLEATMPTTTVLWQLDYGGLNDSAGNKVAVWSVTVISSKDSKRKQEHFDFFFDQTQSKGDTSATRAKKDGNTGIFMLGEMLDPRKSPNNDNVSLFAAHYPDVTDLIFSGDTGNGYRAYQMLEELSCMMSKYGYRVKLIPLAPGHAWNRTDARIAHMNTFLNVVQSKSRVLGAYGVAATFRAASDPRLRNQRKYMARSHIFHRVVKVDREEAQRLKRSLGAPLVSTGWANGRMGVRGFLYFEFEVTGADGEAAYMPGYARVREHANPAMEGNPTYVYTWRKDLSSSICQPCSDAKGGPVQLTINGCTKKKCKKNANEYTRVIPGMPLGPSMVSLDKAGEQSVQPKPRQKKQRQSNRTETTKLIRQIRAVQGAGKGGKMEIWLYVPEHKGDRSGAKRRGWWLYPEPKRPRHYYIGPLEDVQGNKKTVIHDVAVFNDFPFTRVVKVSSSGTEIPKTIRCVTDRPLSDQEKTLARGDSKAEEPLYDWNLSDLDVEDLEATDETSVEEMEDHESSLSGCESAEGTYARSKINPSLTPLLSDTNTHYMNYVYTHKHTYRQPYTHKAPVPAHTHTH